MPISSRPFGKYDVSGTNNTLNLRWSQIWGRGSDDSIILNKKNVGGWGYINLGSGNDTVTLASAGDYTLQLVGVETIKADLDATTLRLRSDATTSTDGSFTAITAGYGVQNITFTGAVRDNTISLGDLTDTVTFDATNTEWQGFKEGGRVYVVDLNTGYEVEISSDVEYVRIINSSTSSYNTANYQDNANHSSSWVDGWVDVSALQDGDTFGASLADAISANNVQFLSTSIVITAPFGGYAGAYGTTEAATSGFGGYWHYAGNPGWAQIGGGVPGTINLLASTEVNSSNTISPLDGFTWVFFMGDSNDPYGYSFGGTRLIIGTDNSDSGGAMNQSSDTLSSVYGSYWDTDNYAMYGFDGNDVIVAGAFNDTVWGGDGNDTITGGAGADTLSGEGDTDTVSYADVTLSTSHGLANLSGVAINLTAAPITASTIATAMGGTVVLGGGAGVAGASLAAGSAGYLATTAANSTVTMVRDTVTDFEAVIGSSLADYIALGDGGMTATGGAGADYILGGDGNDVFNYTATADIVAGSAFIDSVVGGDGTDAINLTTSTGITIAVTDSWARIGTVEKITAGASAGVISITAHDNITAAGITAIDLSGDTNATGTNVVDISGDTTGSIITAITGSAGIDIITGSAVAQTIDGGAGNDVINYTATANIVDGGEFIDSVVGGDGTADAINLTTATGVTIAVTDSWARIGTVEKITAGASAGVISITAHDDITDSGITAIDLSGDTDADGNNVVDISGDTTGSIITAITGSAGIDTITGSAIDQTIDGGAGNDVISGGTGADVLTGGAGADTFVYANGTVATVLIADGDGNGAEAEITVDVGAGTYSVGNQITITGVATADVVYTVTAADVADADVFAQNLGDAVVAAAGSVFALGTVVVAAGVATVTAANDDSTTLTVTSAVTLGDTGVTVVTADVITDFTTADDLLSVGVDGTIAGNVVIADGTGSTDFSIDADVAFNAGALVYVQYNAINSGNAYVAVDRNGSGVFDAGDSFIVLTGVNLVAEIATTNFIA